MRFLSKWKALCIDHGVAVMHLIVEEEKTQMNELSKRIDKSSLGLDHFKDTDEFQKHNDLLTKEIEKTHYNLEVMKQSEFKRDLDHKEKD